MTKGTKFSEEHRSKISNSLKGRKLSDEQKKKMSDAKKGKPSNCAKSVIIIYKNIEYKFTSMTEAETFFIEQMGIKVFYWLRRDIPKKFINDVQLVQIGDIVKHKQSDEELEKVG